MGNAADFVASFVTISKLEVQGKTVHVRSIGSREWLSVRDRQVAGETVGDYVIAALGLCDERGNRLYENPEDLAGLPPVVATDIAQAVLRESKLLPESHEDAAKN